MKNIVKLIAFVVLTVIVGSCNKNEYKYTYDGATLVQSIESSGTFFVLEDAGVTYKVKYQLIGSALNDNISIPYEILDTAEINGIKVYSTLKLEDGIVDISEENLVVPAGELFGELTLSGVYDSLNFGEVDTIIIKINDGSTTKVDSYNNIILIKVQKYYPFIAEEYPGYYSGFYSGAILGTEVPTSPGLEIAVGEEPQTLVINSGFYQEQIDDWGETWTDGPYPITVYMNTDDPTNFTVELPEVQYIGTTNGTWDYWAQPYPAPGSFNAATKELQIIFYVSVYGGDQAPQDIGEYNVILDDATAKLLEENMITKVPVISRK